MTCSSGASKTDTSTSAEISSLSRSIATPIDSLLALSSSMLFISGEVSKSLFSRLSDVETVSSSAKMSDSTSGMCTSSNAVLISSTNRSESMAVVSALSSFTFILAGDISTSIFSGFSNVRADSPSITNPSDTTSEISISSNGTASSSPNNGPCSMACAVESSMFAISRDVSLSSTNRSNSTAVGSAVSSSMSGITGEISTSIFSGFSNVRAAPSSMAKLSYTTSDISTSSNGAAISSPITSCSACAVVSSILAISADVSISIFSDEASLTSSSTKKSSDGIALSSTNRSDSMALGSVLSSSMLQISDVISSIFCGFSNAMVSFSSFAKPSTFEISSSSNGAILSSTNKFSLTGLGIALSSSMALGSALSSSMLGITGVISTSIFSGFSNDSAVSSPAKTSDTISEISSFNAGLPMLSTIRSISTALGSAASSSIFRFPVEISNSIFSRFSDVRTVSSSPKTSASSFKIASSKRSSTLDTFSISSINRSCSIVLGSKSASSVIICALSPSLISC